MPINSRHPEYKQRIAEWKLTRDCTRGSKAVKAAGAEYLPYLSGQDSAEYEAYKKRALFYEATFRTLIGLVGSVFRRPAIVTAPEKEKGPEGWLQHCTATRKGHDAIERRTVAELLTTGKVGLLVDSGKVISKSSPLWLAAYSAESIINWQYGEDVDGKRVLTLVVIEEEFEEPSLDDPLDFACYKRWKIFKLTKDPGSESTVYVIETWREVGEGKDPPANRVTDSKKKFYKSEEDIYPSFGGKRLQFIPFEIVTCLDEETGDIKAPLESVAVVNISHYQSSADIEHGAHYTALPTPWVSGAGTNTTPLKIGSGMAWMIGEATAKVGMLEFSGSGLKAIDDRLTQKESMMAVLGARILEEPKKQVEAAETHAIRRTGEESVLAAVARAASAGINKVLEYAMQWDPTLPKMAIELNTDYGSRFLDSASLTSLVSAWQQGAISYETLFYNFKASEMYEEQRTLEEEKESIAQDAADGLANSPKNGMNLDAEDDEEEGGVDPTIPSNKSKAKSKSVDAA